jgi:hypothetical protein
MRVIRTLIEKFIVSKLFIIYNHPMFERFSEFKIKRQLSLNNLH